MRRAAVIAMAIGVIGLILPAGAMATTKTINAVVKGDANSKITIKVVIERGMPKSVKSFAIRNVDSTCAEGGQASGSIKNLDLSPMLSFQGGVGVTQTLGFKASGAIDPNAQKVKDGKIEFFVIEDGDRIVESCGSVSYKMAPKNN